MDTILVPTDFSRAATNAVDYATGLAIALNAELCLFHVSQVPMIVGDVPMEEEEAEIRANSESQLEELMKAVKSNSAGKVQVNIELSVGDFNQELEIVTKDTNPFLVVMGSLGKSAVERFFLGSHTIHAMKHLRCPLITVPPQARFSAVRKIGLAYDFEQDVDTSSFETIRLIVKAFHAELHVINIGKKNAFIEGHLFDSGVMEERMKDLKPDYHFITGQDSDAGILDFTEKNQMDLLIVLPGIHGLMEKLNHRSHGKQFLLHSHVPILSIRS